MSCTDVHYIIHNELLVCALVEYPCSLITSRHWLTILLIVLRPIQVFPLEFYSIRVMNFCSFARMLKLIKKGVEIFRNRSRSRVVIVLPTNLDEVLFMLPYCYRKPKWRNVLDAGVHARLRERPSAVGCEVTRNDLGDNELD